MRWNEKQRDGINRITGPRLGGNFELRTIRVVTLCSRSIRTAVNERTARLRATRFAVTGCPLLADKELAALFEASSLIHVGRNGLRRPIEKTGVSRLPPSYRHVVVSPGTILLRRARVKPWFLFPIA